MGSKLHWPVQPIQPIIPFPVVILLPNRVLYVPQKLSCIWCTLLYVPKKLSCIWCTCDYGNLRISCLQATLYVPKMLSCIWCTLLYVPQKLSCIWSTLLHVPQKLSCIWCTCDCGNLRISCLQATLYVPQMLSCIWCTLLYVPQKLSCTIAKNAGLTKGRILISSLKQVFRNCCYNQDWDKQKDQINSRWSKIAYFPPNLATHLSFHSQHRSHERGFTVDGSEALWLKAEKSYKIGQQEIT